MDEKALIDIVIGTIVPRGTIISWYPASDAKQPDPKVWAVCDGSDGTPDLRNLFVRGVSDVANVGLDASAQDTHSHSAATGPVQDHFVQSTTKGPDDLSTAFKEHTHSVKVQPASNVPRNFRLMYFMKR